MSPSNVPLLHALLGPEAEQIGCDECFAQLDRYVDLEATAQEAESAIPGMAAHLDGCPACHEEHESLLELVTTHTDGDHHG